MKKILAIALALCLALSLSVTAFAVNSPNTGVAGGSSSVSGSAANSKYVYSVTTESGAPLTATIDNVAAGEAYDELVALVGNNIVGVYYINITSAVSADEIISIDVYAPGVNSDCTVVVYDEWEVLPEVSLKANGNRATITGPAGVFTTWNYVAIVSKGDVFVQVPQEDTTNDEDNENVDADTPVVDVEDEDNTPAPAPVDTNPGTGVALAVVPMIVAAAAVVVSKRR